MKKLVTILLLFSFVSSYGQGSDTTKYIFYRYQYGVRHIRMQADSVFGLPFRDTNFIPQRPGSITVRPADSLAYYWNGQRWSQFSESENIYNSDGTLTGNRAMDMGGFTLNIFDGANELLLLSPWDGSGSFFTALASSPTDLAVTVNGAVSSTESQLDLSTRFGLGSATLTTTVDATQSRMAYSFRGGNPSLSFLYHSGADPDSTALIFPFRPSAQGDTVLAHDLITGQLYRTLASGTGSDPTAIMRNATGGGVFVLNDYSYADSGLVKNLIAGTGVTFDTTLTSITINASGGNNFANANLTFTGDRSHTLADFDMLLNHTGSTNYNFSYLTETENIFESYKEYQTSGRWSIVNNAAGSSDALTYASIQAQGTAGTSTRSYFKANPTGIAEIDGGIKAIDYGTGAKTGTATYNLAVDADGDVIEVATGGGADSIINVGAQYRLGVPNTMNLKTIAGTGGIVIDTATANVVVIDGTAISVAPNLYSLPSSLYNSKFIVPVTAILRVSNSFSSGNPITWDFINTSNHGTIFADSVYPAAGGVVMRYPLTKNIFVLQGTTDESFADHNISVGGSVGLSTTTFSLGRRLKAGVTLTGAGTNAWAVSGNTTYFQVDTFNRATGVTRFTRYATGTTLSYDALANAAYKNRFAPPAYWGTTDSIKFLTGIGSGGGFQEGFKLHYKDFNPVIAVLPSADDRVYIDLGTYSQALGVTTWGTTNQFLTTTFNIWVNGWLEAYMIVTPRQVGSNVIQWQQFDGTETAYKIYRSTSLYGAQTLMYSGTNKNYTDATAVSGTLYYYHYYVVLSGVDTYKTYFTALTL